MEMYKTCPAKYKFHYIEKIKGNYTASPLLFGTAIDQSLNYVLENFNEKTWTIERAKEIFLEKMNAWDGSNRLQFFKSELPEGVISYSEDDMSMQEEVWHTICQRGLNCLDNYVEEILPKLKRVVSVQNTGILSNAEGDEMIFVVDFIAELQDGRVVLLDNKTSSAKYPKNAVIESQQLSLYLESFPEIKWAGYCVMIKNPDKVGFKSKTQFMVDEIPDTTKQKAFDLAQNTCQAIKEEKFDCNPKGCFAFGKKCEYWSACKDGDYTGLIPTNRG